MSRRRGAAALVAAAALVLAGCASVPTSGPVRLGDPVAGDDGDRGVVAVVRPPEAGASPSQIVSGFLEANTAPGDDYAVARSYLAPEVAEAWDPSAGAVVYDDSTGFGLTERGARVLMSAPQEGVIDGVGAFEPSPPRSRFSTTFSLRLEEGQWRIVDVPRGLLVTLRDVQRGYRGLDRYFLNAGATRLVPDRVLVPSARPGVQTALVRGLLTGPSSWLAPAVRTAVPSGTGLAIDAVPVNDGIATVDLTEQALSAGPDDRRLLAAQLTWALTALDGVSGVRITVEGQQFVVPGAPEVLTRETFAALDPDGIADGAPGYLVVGERLARIVGAFARPVPGAFGDGSTAVGLPSVRLDEEVAAATLGNDSGTGPVFQAPLAATGTPATKARISRVGSLSWGTDGGLWVLDAASGRVVVVPSRGAAITVRTPAGLRLRAVRPARDGSRAAVLADDGTGGTSLLLLRIVRQGAVVALESPRLVENRLSQVVAVAWGDADTLVTLGRTADGVRQVYQVVVGGTAVASLGGVQGMSAVAAAPGSPVLVEGDGGVWQNNGAGWRLVGSGRSPVYPG